MRKWLSLTAPKVLTFDHANEKIIFLFALSALIRTFATLET